jgi:hypothetical protein
MIRKSMFSLFSGTVFAALLAFGPSALAACDGYCADRRVDGGVYAGCIKYYDGNDKLYDVKCAYTSSKVIDDDAAAVQSDTQN